MRWQGFRTHPVFPGRIEKRAKAVLGLPEASRIHLQALQIMTQVICRGLDLYGCGLQQSGNIIQATVLAHALLKPATDLIELAMDCMLLTFIECGEALLTQADECFGMGQPLLLRLELRQFSFHRRQRIQLFELKPQQHFVIMLCPRILERLTANRPGLLPLLPELPDFTDQLCGARIIVQQ